MKDAYSNYMASSGYQLSPFHDHIKLSTHYYVKHVHLICNCNCASNCRRKPTLRQEVEKRLCFQEYKKKLKILESSFYGDDISFRLVKMYNLYVWFGNSKQHSVWHGQVYIR